MGRIPGTVVPPAAGSGRIKGSRNKQTLFKERALSVATSAEGQKALEMLLKKNHERNMRTVRSRHGQKALEMLLKKNPLGFFRIIAAIVPKEHDIHLGEVEADPLPANEIEDIRLAAVYIAGRRRGLSQAIDAPKRSLSLAENSERPVDKLSTDRDLNS